ncbi:MAG TPA: NAD-dependent succinate-semialdehyde dehydrogenase [Acidiferrobacteraceae bacterium]|nr:NAD-dependent succinate-semialdehyde dehydrogenase [Acidiferrobacteraceae bacterium]
MTLETFNPATGESVKIFPTWGQAELEAALSQVAAATPDWQATCYVDRSALMRKAAAQLRAEADRYASIITLEMGKLKKEALGEVEKCASVCDYYADNAEQFLTDEVIESDAQRSLVVYQPMGTVLAVMPWNFPFWQVFRFAAPGLMAGNTGVLKHASNVPQCALAIEEVFHKAGFPAGVFRSLMIGAPQVQGVIEDSRIHAVTLTGSEPAGRKVAAIAGANLKKSLLELGGSDAFIVLHDADLELAATQGVVSRFLNAGQSCIAAKRFIIVDAVAEDFLALFKERIEALVPGDPNDEATSLAPMARDDLRDELHHQVVDSIAAGAVVVSGCEPVAAPGSFYQPSIIDQVAPGMRAYDEELFGPVAIVIRAKDEEDALSIANSSRFGLGGSIWTKDRQRGEALARRLQAGASFVNGMVKSDPRLPFGGIKASGYGRELSLLGIKEFVNAKTIWIG